MSQAEKKSMFFGGWPEMPWKTKQSDEEVDEEAEDAQSR